MIPFHYTEAGNLNGPSIIFIHAFPLNAQMWREQVSALQKDYRVITFDIRGFGQSKLSHPYTLEFIVDDVILLMDQLKIGKTVLCGLSMGGYVALRAVQRNPNRFSAVVLADTKSEPDLDQAKLARYSGIKAIEEKGLLAFVDDFVGKAVAQTFEVSQSPAFEKAKQIAMTNPVSGVQAGLLALLSRTDMSGDLGKIKIPTLILHGELDSVIPMTAAKSLNEKILGSKFFVISKAGHLSNLENPQEFNEKLIEFLAGLK